jgi:hypothetical protein
VRQSFTVFEANATIPRLNALFVEVMQIRTQLKPMYKRLEQKGFAPVGDDFEPAVPKAPADVVRERTTFRALLDVLKGVVAEIQACGCEIKDIESGLVDWYAQVGGRDVYLCWRFGEKEVAFFHELDTGFAGRRPIDELGNP